MGDAFSSIFALFPEADAVLQVWGERACLAAVGMLAAYVFLRLRASRRDSAAIRPVGFRGLRLVLGGMVATGLWCGLEALHGLNFLREIWTALPPPHVNAINGLLLIVCGWVGWTIALSEVFRLISGYRSHKH